MINQPAKDRTALHTLTLEQKVRFLAALRDVVKRRAPVNNAGAPLVSDFDLIAASDEEMQEALEKSRPNPSWKP